MGDMLIVLILGMMLSLILLLLAAIVRGQSRIGKSTGDDSAVRDGSSIMANNLAFCFLLVAVVAAILAAFIIQPPW